MNNPANQPSHRPLREGEIMQKGDETEIADGWWRPILGDFIGKRWTEAIYRPMRRPVKD